MNTRRPYRRAAVLAVVLLAVIATGCSSSSKPKAAPTGPATNGASVTISGFAFKAGAVKVKTGSTVIWGNHDTTTHTVTSTGGPATFDSGDLAVGKTFSHTFTTPGTYSYHCSIHASMTGTVVVTG